MCPRLHASSSYIQFLTKPCLNRPCLLRPSERRYAVGGTPSTPAGCGLTWPSCPNPTPYEILGLPSTGPYNKSRFYELVKLYHPDLRHQVDSHISPAVRLERYRLIVQANAILGEPEKRKAFDLYGGGWTNGQPRPRDAHPKGPFREWRNDPQSTYHNASWQDWERWYKGHRRRPSLSSHAVVSGAMVAILAVGSILQAYRLDARHGRVVDRRKATHAAIVSSLRTNYDSSSEQMGSRMKIDRFLDHRGSDV